MGSAQLTDVKDELAIWRSRGLSPRFWLRDDDAIDVSAPLGRLRTIAERYDVQVGVAVIPASIQPGLPGHLREHRAQMWPMVHGWTHANHRKPDGHAEFGEERLQREVASDLTAALAAFQACFPDIPPVFVPPFSQFAPKWEPLLPRLGYAALSSTPTLWEVRAIRTFANHAWLRLPRRGGPPVFNRVNCHIDIIDWKAGSALDGDLLFHRLLGELRFRRNGGLPAETPIGILSHHLVHNEAIWSSMERLLDELKADATATFVTCESLFAWSNGSVSVSHTGADGSRRAGVG